MTTLQKLLSITTILTILLSASLKLQAQSQFNLSGLECPTATPGIDSSLKTTESREYSINIGKSSFVEIAYLYNKYIADFGDVLDSVEKPAQVFCRVAAGVSQLNLAVGLDKESKVTDREDIILFEVYIDSKLTERRYVREGETQNLSINVKPNQNIALKAACLRPEWWNNCPRLSFVETILPK